MPLSEHDDVIADVVRCRRGTRYGPDLRPEDEGRGILSFEPGTPEHAARVAQRAMTDTERDGL